jgi:iron complex outermembrane receptor protein
LKSTPLFRPDWNGKASTNGTSQKTCHNSTVNKFKLRDKSLRNISHIFHLISKAPLKDVMRRFVVGTLNLFLGFVVFAQNQSSFQDTIILDEVVTFGELRKYQSGAKIEQISSKQFDLNQDGNLEQLLSRTLPIPFKANAGSFSTLRIRGSAPDHTSINFGGININSLTLGHSNVSSVPTYLFDKVGVQFGSSSSVNGSGNIGGAIHLGLRNNWVDGFKAETRVSNGSFGEQLYGTKLFLGNGNFESVTRAYYYSKKNDFKFKSTLRDFETGETGFTDTQQNADIENYGILQELNYKFSTNNYFIFNLWYENNWYLAQQNMGVNFLNPEKREEYLDNHLRVWTSYKNRSKALKYEINGGYVFDNATNNNNNKETIQTQRLIAEAFIEHDFISNASYKIGIKASRIKPKVHAYIQNLEYEDRIDFYASYYHRFFNKLTATLNLRQGFVTDFSVPFTPSVGFNYPVLSREKSILNVNGNVARSYRVPTFNDRFWVPGGNPDLNPEKGMNYELGSTWSYCNADVSGNIKANAFFMNIDDWIVWKNGGAFWYAENVQKVHSKGFELMTDWKYKVMGLISNLGFNYSYTNIRRVESVNKISAINRQLEYVPLHSANLYSVTTYKNFDLTFDESYTHKQYTDEENKNILDAYFLLNMALTYNLKINENNKLRINGMINNLLNTSYQSSWGYAMPGINYRLSITYNFN